MHLAKTSIYIYEDFIFAKLNTNWAAELCRLIEIKQLTKYALIVN